MSVNREKEKQTIKCFSLFPSLEIKHLILLEICQSLENISTDHRHADG